MQSPVDQELERSLQQVLVRLTRHRSEDGGAPPQIDESVRGSLVALLDALPGAEPGLLGRAVAADPDAEELIRHYALRLQAYGGLLQDGESLGLDGVDALLRRIAGTAGCYGFPTIAERAARCRERLHRVDGPIPEHLLRPVLDEIARL